MYIQGITKGDTILFEMTMDEDITGWEIRAELFDYCGHSIKLANLSAGGSESQISMGNLLEGIFTILVPKDQTDLFDKKSYLEVEIVDATGDKETILNGEETFVDLKCQRIKWTNPNE